MRPSPHSTLAPGLDYLDVMALWDHNVFLGQQVLDSVLRDDVLYLKNGGEQAGAGAPLTRSSARMAEQGRQGHPPSAMATASTPWEGCPSPKWGLGGGAQG